MRKESFPICFFAPSDVKSSIVAVAALMLVNVERGMADGVKEYVDGTMANAVRRQEKLNRTMVD